MPVMSCMSCGYVIVNPSLPCASCGYILTLNTPAHVPSPVSIPTEIPPTLSDKIEPLSDEVGPLSDEIEPLSDEIEPGWQLCVNTKDFNPHLYHAMLQDKIRLMDESMVNAKTSEDIETVVKQYGYAIEMIRRLCKHEGNPIVTFANELPSKILANALAGKAEIMTAAVQRAFNAMTEKNALLKSEKASKKQQKKFFDLLTSLFDKFPPETIDFVCSLYFDEH